MKGGSFQPWSRGHVAPLPLGTLAARTIALGVLATVSAPASVALGERLKVDRVTVPAGPFKRGSTRALDERPVETKQLKRFQIDRTEVTRAMYARCVAARRC